MHRGKLILIFCVFAAGCRTNVSKWQALTVPTLWQGEPLAVAMGPKLANLHAQATWESSTVDFPAGVLAGRIFAGPPDCPRVLEVVSAQLTTEVAIFPLVVVPLTTSTSARFAVLCELRGPDGTRTLSATGIGDAPGGDPALAAGKAIDGAFCAIGDQTRALLVK